MTEVIGNESKTIHRLLEWQIEKFKKNDENPVDVDFLIVDGFSMLDINAKKCTYWVYIFMRVALFVKLSSMIP
jgi:hypothetical protein